MCVISFNVGQYSDKIEFHSAVENKKVKHRTLFHMAYDDAADLEQEFVRLKGAFEELLKGRKEGVDWTLEQAAQIKDYWVASKIRQAYRTAMSDANAVMQIARAESMIKRMREQGVLPPIQRAPHLAGFPGSTVSLLPPPGFPGSTFPGPPIQLPPHLARSFPPSLPAPTPFRDATNAQQQ